MNWRTQAACLGCDPRLFDPIEQTSLDEKARIDYATAICQACPVADHCLEDAVDNYDHGVRGGVLLASGRPMKPTWDGKRCVNSARGRRPTPTGTIPANAEES